VTRSAVVRAEVAANLRLALPLVFAQMSFVSMGIVSTLIAGRLGPSALASVAIGSNIWFMIFVVFMGLFMAVAPIVAQRRGAGRPAAEAGAVLRGALWLALAAGVFWMCLLYAISPLLLDLLALDSATRGYALGYLHAVAPGAIPYAMFFALRNAAEGCGQTQTTLIAGLTGFTVNFFGAYGLASGRWGLPALGPAGCGVAMSLAALSMTGTFALLFWRLPALKPVALYSRSPGLPWPEMAEVLRLGRPIALILAAEAWLFLIGTLLMARFDTLAVAAHQIAVNFCSLAFVVPVSIGIATAVQVGRAAGAGDAAGVLLRGQIGIGLGATFALVSASIMAGLPNLLVSFYTQDEGVISLAVTFLYLAALFQIFDCVQATANGALRGIKDTRTPMIITVAAYWLVGLPLALGLAFATRLGPAGLWWGFIGGLAVAATGLGLRFARLSRVAA